MFQIIEVQPDEWDLPEQLGTKPKFWFKNNQFLFKEVRPGTGEDWSEKVACELCTLLGIPRASYELGVWRDKRGVVSESFVASGARLVHGNELLTKFYPRYPARKFRGVRHHTVRIVMSITGGLKPPIGFQPFPGVHNATDVFVGYLMLDAWISNVDRHHENWGLVLTEDRVVHLAPSYDHASSLGRIETDVEKRDRLQTRDRNRDILAYVSRAKTPFYASLKNVKPLSPLDAFLAAAVLFPQAALAWLYRLQEISDQDTERILRDIPPDRISETGILFAHKILVINRERLLKLVDKLM